MVRHASAAFALLVLGYALAQPWVSVPADGQRVALTGLQPGATYQLRVSGWMAFGAWQVNGRPLLNDACFEFNAKGYPDPLPVVNANVGVTLCGSFRADHTYLSAPFVAPSSQVTLWVFDTDYRDNSGAVLAEAIQVTGGGADADAYCILRNQDLYGPPVCYQFYLADTLRTAGAMAELTVGGCAVTDLAARQGWAVDPFLGGPYRTWEAADGAMNTLTRFGGDLYGCLAALGAWDPFADGDDPWAGWEAWDPEGDDSCFWAFDGECDEPGIGTGVCLPGTDTFDCRSLVAVAPAWPPENELPAEVERRSRTLNHCDVWSVANSGGVEGTVDAWDVSTIPDGVVFDLRFQAHDLPDRFRVTYRGATVLETGWRGSSRYQGNPTYPGGIAGPGSGEATAMFAKAGFATFTVTVLGGESGTEWEYRVRCRRP